MNKGWEVDEDQSLDHFLSLTECLVIKNQVVDKPTVSAKISPKSKMRFRTSSMPKVEEFIEPKKEIVQQIQDIQIKQQPIKTQTRQQIKQSRPLDSRITIRSTLFQNPIEKEHPIKIGRTLQPKFFNPLLREQQHKLGLSRKLKSMNNIFNDERITYKRDFSYLKQQRSNIVYVALSK
ncbi:unnamed protein product [Paramecium pentaurelia]|uniref:Uncharacterized protein n=1 Tax=Paramecium pentaurelia TaxID=43138 RepID=A0A8S1XIQ5_9CILI|nr:unnamed protein product [Paramecium pentaurelia]